MASNCSFIKEDPDFKTNSNSKLLKPLDDILRCRICFDYFNDCVITKCNHNYCSVCIRRYMLYKSQCPTCFQEAFEPDLRNNRLVDELLQAFIKIKDNFENNTAPETNIIEDTCKVGPSTSVTINTGIQTTEDAVNVKKEKTDDDTFYNEVTCPVCYQKVLADKINIHLDACLKAEEREKANERRYLPKLVYHLLSDKDIKKKLKEHGLNTSGDRQALIRRHKNFIVLYNANCDSLNPRPVTSLLLEIEEQELEERLNSFPRQSQVHKRSDAREIEQEQETHVRRYQSQYHALIQDVQLREIKRISQESRSDSSGSVIVNKTGDHCHIKKEIASEDEELEHIPTSSHIKASHPMQRRDYGLSEPVSLARKDKDIVLLPSQDINKEIESSIEEKESKDFFKSMEKLQDSLTSSSPSPIDEPESKIPLSLYRKRKKGRTSLEPKCGSPKKKRGIKKFFNYG